MPVGHAFATGALRRSRWRLVFAAVATAVAMVGLPTAAASAAPVLKPGFNIGTFADLTSVNPCGTHPYISNVNYRTHQVAAANLAVVKVPPDGRICFSSFVPTDLVIDLAGWYLA